MSGALRIVDSGLRTARANLAMTEALASGRRAGTSPDTLRFQHFPPSAIIGRHQRLEREINLDWVRTHGVATARRMTGGGAIVMGPGILGWEIVVARAKVPELLADVVRVICTAAANGLSSLGVDATFRPRNDIEIDGRKVSGTGGYFDGDVLVFQGTVLVELDRDLLTQALNVPAHKLGKRGLAALTDRIVDLRECLKNAPPMNEVQACLAQAIASALGMNPTPGALLEREERAAQEIHDAEIGTEAFVAGLHDEMPKGGESFASLHETKGGAVEAALSLRAGGDKIVDQILIAGDFFVTPPRVVADLEAHLRARRADTIEMEARQFLAQREASFLGIDRSDIVAAIGAVARLAINGSSHG